MEGERTTDSRHGQCREAELKSVPLGCSFTPLTAPSSPWHPEDSPCSPAWTSPHLLLQPDFPTPRPSTHPHQATGCSLALWLTSHFCLLLAGWPWASDFASLSSSFLTSKMGITVRIVGTFPVVQWLRICLSMQGIQVQSLVCKLRSHEATKPACHSSSLCCCCCQVASVVSDSVRPHRRQPTRLPCPWNSPGKNTGVGFHFLLQCMKVKSESEVTCAPHERSHVPQLRRRTPKYFKIWIVKDCNLQKERS